MTLAASGRRDELQETNEQFRDAFTQLCRCLPHSTFSQADGLWQLFGGVTLPMFNQILLGSPVSDVADLDARIQASLEQTSKVGYPWMFSVCLDWLPEAVRQHAPECFARHGLAAAIPLTGMATDQLAPPRRPAPALEFQQVASAADAQIVADLNSISYHMPLEWGREAIAADSMWQDDVCLGTIAYAQGKPVATASIVPCDGRLYVAMVATDPEHRQKGYAEAVMRHALAEAQRRTGLRRTTLHATEMGAPLYTGMGYQVTGRFMAYMKTEFLQG